VSYARKPVARAKRKSKTGSIEFRRTLIPSCLVVGSMFVLLTILFFFQPADAALRQARVFVPIAIGVLGVVLLAVGVFNMLLVKKELERKQSQSAE
jgi:protein-S-isoprenylcysteine O-methyltransferase Ste14